MRIVMMQNPDTRYERFMCTVYQSIVPSIILHTILHIKARYKISGYHQYGSTHQPGQLYSVPWMNWAWLQATGQIQVHHTCLSFSWGKVKLIYTRTLKHLLMFHSLAYYWPKYAAWPSSISKEKKHKYSAHNERERVNTAEQLLTPLQAPMLPFFYIVPQYLCLVDWKVK
jgi:hypothetical protein